jgi:hypothetical protein
MTSARSGRSAVRTVLDHTIATGIPDNHVRT